MVSLFYRSLYLVTLFIWSIQAQAQPQCGEILKGRITQIKQQHTLEVLDHQLGERVTLQGVRFDSRGLFALVARKTSDADQTSFDAHHFLDARISKSEKVLSFMKVVYSPEAPHKVQIDMLETDPRYRGNGLTALLFNRMLEKYPKVNQILSTLTDTNVEVALSYLIKKLKNHPLFNHKEYQTTHSTNSQILFRKCCSNIPLKDFQGELAEAIRQTPSYKVRKVHGFTELSDIQFRDEYFFYGIKYSAQKSSLTWNN